VFATHANILTIVQTNKHTQQLGKEAVAKDGVALLPGAASPGSHSGSNAAPDTVRECFVGDADRNTHSKH
jgi:hypothetical protein